MTHYIACCWLAAWLLHRLGAPPVNYYNQGNREYAAGRYAQAEQAYRKAAVRGPLQARAYFNAGNAAYRRGDYGRAVTYYESALDGDPNDADVWHNLELARRKAEAQTADAPPAPAAEKRGLALARSPASPAMSSPSRNGETDADRLLSRMRAEERRLSGYLAPRPVEINTGDSGRDIFDLPPDQLADYIREQTQAGYPFKPGSSLWEKKKEEKDEIDW